MVQGGENWMIEGMDQEPIVVPLLLCKSGLSEETPFQSLHLELNQVPGPNLDVCAETSWCFGPDLMCDLPNPRTKDLSCRRDLRSTSTSYAVESCSLRGAFKGGKGEKKSII